MTKQELLKVYVVAELLFSTFKSENPETNKLKFEMQNQLWYDMLKDLPLDLIITAMKEYSKESAFLNIGQVVKKCEDIITTQNSIENIITESDILREINESLCSAGSYQERFNNLSDVAKKIVGSSSQLKCWGYMDSETFDTVISSLILRSARNILEQKTKIDKNNTVKQIAFNGKLLLNEER